MTKGAIISGGGATGFYKAAEVVDGAAVKFYKGAVIVDGQAVRIYQNGIEWTTQTVPIPTDKLHWPPDTTYGNTASSSAYIHTDSSNFTDDWGCYVEYIFSEPLQIKAGDSLGIGWSITNNQFVIYPVNISISANTDSNTIWLVENPSISSNYETHSFSSDMQITSLFAQTNGSLTMVDYTAEILLGVTVHSSEYGTFLLNNSGSSDQT